MVEHPKTLAGKEKATTVLQQIGSHTACYNTTADWLAQCMPQYYSRLVSTLHSTVLQQTGWLYCMIQLWEGFALHAVADCLFSPLHSLCPEKHMYCYSHSSSFIIGFWYL